MRLVFANRSFSRHEIKDDSAIVPLSAGAMKSVIDNELDYIRIEDYIRSDYSEKDREALWSIFRSLFEKGDEIVSIVHKDARLRLFGPFSLFAMKLRVNWETRIHFFCAFLDMIEQIKPDSLHFWGECDAQEDYQPHSPNSRFSSNMYVSLLAELAKRYHISLEIDNTAILKKDEVVKISLKQILITKMKYLFKDIKILNRNRVIIKETGIPKIKARAVFLQTTWGVYYYSQFFKKIRIASKFRYSPQTETGFSYEYNSMQPIVNKLNELFSTDVSFIISEVLNSFSGIIPVEVEKATAIEKKLLSLKADYLFYTNPSEDILPLLMAAKWNKEIRTVCKSHGDSVFDLTLWRENEFKPASVYLTEFAEFGEYCADMIARTDYGTLVLSDAIRLQKNIPSDKSEKSKPRLIYVPGLFDTHQTIDRTDIPIPLYYRIQFQILEALNGCKDFQVVYKCLPGANDHYHEPIPEIINEKFKNITVSRNTMDFELKSADYCLFDTPSSAMWDSINHRVKCKSLLWKELVVRETALEYYGEYIEPFNSDLDVAEKVNRIIAEMDFRSISEHSAEILKKTTREIALFFKNAVIENLASK